MPTNKELSYVNYNGDTYEINAVKVNGHTVQTDVPANYEWDKSSVQISELLNSGNKIGVITIDGDGQSLYAPAYTATSPISVNASTLQISHASSGVSANTYGVTATTDVEPAFGGSFNVPGFTVNATGHITAAGSHKVYIPTLSVSQNLTSGTKVGTITVNGNGVDLYAPTNTNTTYTLSKTDDDLKLTPSSGQAQTVTLNTVDGTHNGLMSTALYSKLNGISENANKVEISTILNSGTQIATVTVDGVTSATLYAPTNTNTTYTLSKDGNDLKLTPSSGTAQTVTLNTAGTTVDGLMSKEDKQKLENLSKLEISSLNTTGKAVAKWTVDGVETGTIYDTRDIWYATCPTGAGTATKVVTTTNGDFRLEPGATVFIKFTYANTSTSASLNIDGKGAKTIKAYGDTNPTASTWAAGAVVRFTYDGTNFFQENAQIASTSVYGITKLSDATNSTSTALAGTANAVKKAYDKGVEALNKANEKTTVANAPVYTQEEGTFLIDTIHLNGVGSDIRIPNYPTLSSLGLNGALRFIGISTTAMRDGQTDNPEIDGITSYTPTNGDVVIDNQSHYEYVYVEPSGGTAHWELLGGDGDYALNDEIYDVTNGGTNQKSAVTISPKTTDVYSMTSAGSVDQGTASSLVMEVEDEKLTFSYIPSSPTEVTLPGRSAVIKAWTGYNDGVANTYAAAQAFTPTTKTITLGVPDNG